MRLRRSPLVTIVAVATLATCTLLSTQPTASASQEETMQPTEQPAPSGQAAGSAEEKPPADPCASPEHHQFDFWIGNWEVRDPDGKPAGTNDVTTLYGGCILQEHWQGAKGSVGTSFNLYDAPRGVWHQTWVDGEAGLLVLEGGLEGKDMVLRGHRPSHQDPSVEVLHEIRWTPLADGRVRQHWQVSKDEGATWTTVFDGYYSRKSP